MPSPKKLSAVEIRTRLERLDGWKLTKGKLVRRFRFDDFASCFGFMASMATVSEALHHHPEWQNVYNRLLVRMSTHEAGGVTARDVRWCEQANARYAAFVGKPVWCNRRNVAESGVQLPFSGSVGGFIRTELGRRSNGEAVAASESR